MLHFLKKCPELLSEGFNVVKWDLDGGVIDFTEGIHLESWRLRGHPARFEELDMVPPLSLP